MSLDALLAEVRRRGCGTAAQLAVGLPDGRLLAAASGEAWPGGPTVDVHTPFDLASVTKMVATTAACLVLVERRLLELDAPIGRVLPALHFGARTARELLGHRAGLTPWAPWFEAARVHPDCSGLWPGQTGGRDREAAREHTLQAAFLSPGGPAGVRAYSDLGFLALGALIEAIAAEPLDAFVHREVLAPLGLHTTAYRRLSTSPPAPLPVTGILRPREPAPGQEDRYQVHPQVPVLTPGEVDDDNAWALDGVAGHAGLFGPAADLVRFGRALLEDLEGAGHLVRADTLAAFVAPDPAEGAVRSLGFDRPAAQGSSIGTSLGRGPRGAIGHLGFTGTSLWVDLDQRLVVALLTHRTFPTRTAQAPIRALRPWLHDAVAAWVEAG